MNLNTYKEERTNSLKQKVNDPVNNCAENRQPLDDIRISIKNAQ